MARSNLTESKKNPISSSRGYEGIHRLDPPLPNGASAGLGLERTSVRVSYPGPSNVGSNPFETENGEILQWLEDALSPRKSVVRLRQAIREEIILRGISKSEVLAGVRQTAKEEAESFQHMMRNIFKTRPLSLENCEMVVEQFMPRFEQQKVENHQLASGEVPIGRV